MGSPLKSIFKIVKNSFAQKNLLLLQMYKIDVEKNKVGDYGVMTSEPVVGVVFGRPVEGKTTLSYICLPFHSPTQASQLTGTSSYYRF